MNQAKPHNPEIYGSSPHTVLIDFVPHGGRNGYFEIFLLKLINVVYYTGMWIMTWISYEKKYVLTQTSSQLPC